MRNSKRPDISNNQTIREAIRRIAWRNMVNRDTGAVNGTGKITGYVAKINTDGDLAGTIDVQEYVTLPIEDTGDVKMGYHEGVLLGAIQDNSKGYVIVPKMYSEVLVSQDPETGAEYVSMFSHVDMIQLDSHEKIVVEVKEREEFDATDEDAPDVDGLKETGVMSRTTYLKDSVTTEVCSGKGSSTSNVALTGEKITANINGGASTLEMSSEQIHMKRGNAETTLTSDKAVSQVGGSSVTVEEGTVYVGNTSETDNAVLGKELAGVLSDFLGYLGQMMTTTAMGPQPPINLANFVSLKAKVDAYRAGESGFLTKKVMVQK